MTEDVSFSRFCHCKPCFEVIFAGSKSCRTYLFYAEKQPPKLEYGLISYFARVESCRPDIDLHQYLGLLLPYYMPMIKNLLL